MTVARGLRFRVASSMAGWDLDSRRGIAGHEGASSDRSKRKEPLVGGHFTMDHVGEGVRLQSLDILSGIGLQSGFRGGTKQSHQGWWMNAHSPRFRVCNAWIKCSCKAWNHEWRILSSYPDFNLGYRPRPEWSFGLSWYATMFARRFAGEEASRIAAPGIQGFGPSRVA